MNVKSLIAVFIIVGIGVMLLRTESGESYATGVFDFFKIRVGNFVSGLFGAVGYWQADGGGFRIVMNVDRSSFLEQSYQVINSTLTTSGVVEGAIKIGSVQLHKESVTVEISLDESKGTFEYTVAGTVIFEGTANRIVVDGNTYSSPTGDLNVVFEMIPTELTLTDVSQTKIIVDSATGSVVRLNDDGSIKSTEELAAEKIEISKFSGVLRFGSGTVRLDGLATSVKGTGAQSSFNW